MSIFSKKLWLAGLGFSASVLIVFSGFSVTAESDKGQGKSESPAQPKKTRQHLMEGKLVISQAILRGLVLSDFPLIEKNATALSVVTLADEWAFSNSKQYIRMSDDLRRICKQLAKAGQDKNIDAAALAYQRLTLNCVECHRALRDGLE